MCIFSLGRRRKRPPPPVFLTGEFHRQRSLAGCSPRGHRESNRLSDEHFSCFPKVMFFSFLYLSLAFSLRGGQWEEIHSLRAVELNGSFCFVQRKTFYFILKFCERENHSPETGEKDIFFQFLEVIIGCELTFTKLKASKTEAIRFQVDLKCCKFKI